MAFDVVSFMRLCVSCYGLYGQIKFIPWIGSRIN